MSGLSVRCVIIGLRWDSRCEARVTPGFSLFTLLLSLACDKMNAGKQYVFTLANIT